MKSTWTFLRKVAMVLQDRIKLHFVNPLQHPANIFCHVREIAVLLDGGQHWREVYVDLSVETASQLISKSYTHLSLG